LSPHYLESGRRPRRGMSRAPATVRLPSELGCRELIGSAAFDRTRRSPVTPGLLVGIAAGFGELVGYTLRLPSGYIGDRTGRYWAITIVGYILNLFAVPLLALAAGWQIALVLIIAERMGRALRAPTRDAMLSPAATRIGVGWAFGMHEAMDTTGAIVGPLAVAAALYFGRSYQTSFAMLLIPAVLSMFVLLVARSQFPDPQHLEAIEPIRQPRALSERFSLFSVAAALIGAGYADFSLLAYHFGKTALVAPFLIPVLYSIAMIAAAAAALTLGHWFDRVGLVVHFPVTVISAQAAPLAFLGGAALVTPGTILLAIRNRSPRVGDASGHRLSGAARAPRDCLWIVPHRFWVGVVRWKRPPRNHLRPFHSCGLGPFTRAAAARLACSVRPDDEAADAKTKSITCR
jgi:MFS family permease